MSDRRLLIEIAADSSKFSAEVQKAAADAQQLASLVQRHGKELAKADEERANIKKALLAQISQADRQALQEQLIDAQRHYSNLKTLYNSNKREAGAAEREVTNIVKREAHERTQAARKEHDDRLGFLKSLAAGATGGLAVGGASRVFEEIGRAVKEDITGFIEYGHQIEHISKLMGTTTENASMLAYAFQRFGLSSSDVDRTVVQLTRHIVENEKQFDALGISTRDSNGQLRSSYDIFQNLREVMSQAADGTAKTALQLALASRGGSAAGQSFAELNAILSLNDEQWAALQTQAEAAGRILDERTAKAAYDTQQQMRELGQDTQNLALQFGQIAMGPIRWFVNGLMDIIDTLQVLGSVEGSFFDKFGAFFGAGPIAGAVQQKVAEAKAARNALANASEGGNLIPNEALHAGGGGDPEAEAIRDQIAAIREAAKAREEAMRDALTAFTREREAAIRAIEDERKGREQMFAEMVTQLQEEQRLRDDAHQAEIQRIQDEQRARDDAFAIRQRDRDSEISGIRAEVAAIDRQAQAESDLQNIQNAQKTLDHEQFIEINKTKSETLESYYRRTFDHEQRLSTDTQRLSDAKAKKVIDDRKAELDAQIKAIEAVGAADRRQTEDAKKNADARIREIQREMAEEKKKSEAAVKAIQEQQKTEKAASDAKIQGLRDQLTAEKQRVDDALKQLQRQTEATVKALDDQLKAHQRAAGGIGSAYAAAFNRIREEAKKSTDAVNDLHTALDNLGKVSLSDVGGNTISSGNQGDVPSSNGASGGTINVGGRNIVVPVQSGLLNMGPGQFVLDLLGKLKDRLLQTNNTTLPGFARGGSLTLTEPTMLVNLRSGQPVGLAGEAGIETATFTPGGGQRGGRGGVVINQTIINPGLPEIETLVRRGTFAAIAEADRIDEVRGYTTR